MNDGLSASNLKIAKAEGTKKGWIIRPFFYVQIWYYLQSNLKRYSTRLCWMESLPKMSVDEMFAAICCRHPYRRRWPLLLILYERKSTIVLFTLLLLRIKSLFFSSFFNIGPFCYSSLGSVLLLMVWPCPLAHWKQPARPSGSDSTRD